ncbi:MAG TPA: transposase [Anaerolineales bacterium]|nr:transposase [Anaerolineales bacterium]
MRSKFDPQKHHRHSIRLTNYDYAQPGGYFITIVTYQRALLFGKIVNTEMQLNDFGKIADECWRAIPNHFLNVELGAYVIMPNHVHGIIVIHENRMTMNSSSSVGARHASPLPPRGVKPQSIGVIVGSFKSAVTKRIGHEFNITDIWQRNYYEHVIRNEKDLQNKTDYIEANLMLWDQDDENPVNIKS